VHSIKSNLGYEMAMALDSKLRLSAILVPLCLCVVAATFWLPELHLQIYRWLSSCGIEIHKASFVGHATQIVIYDAILIGSAWVGLRALHVPLLETGWRKPNIAQMLISAGIMALGIILMGEVYAIFKTGSFVVPSLVIAKTWSDLGNASVYIYLFTSVFNAPIEEVFYRGFLLTAIKRRYPAIMAITISALVYAAAHANVSKDLTQVFFSGVILGILKIWGDNLWNPIAAHLTKNIAASWFFVRF